jgi:glutamate racemase
MPHLLVFDSGIGGLGVVEQLRRVQPGARLTYVADNGFYPYGEKADEVLIERILAVIGAGVAALRPDAVVIACNTASTIALGALRARFALPVIGCVPPIKPAAAASRRGHIGLLATAATTRRPYLQELVDKFAGGCAVHSLGKPILADMAELKLRGVPVDMAALDAAVGPLFEKAPAIDAVAIGCTHYTFLLPELGALYPGIAWFDPAPAVARQAEKMTAGMQVADGGANMFLTTALMPDEGLMTALVAAYGFGGVGRLDLVVLLGSVD